MKLLPTIDLDAEKGIPFPAIIERLHERTDDECYTAFHWLENSMHKSGHGTMFPVLDPRDPKWTDPEMSKLVVALMPFPPEITDEIKEMIALGTEHIHREVIRKASSLALPTCYASALNACAASGLSPLCANGDPDNPKTVNDLLEKLGSRLPPIPLNVATALAVTTQYSLETIRDAFA